MNNNINRNDFLFFQNEVFKDMKELERKLTEKINVISTNLNSSKEDLNDNYSKINKKIDNIMTIVESPEKKMKIEDQLNSLKKRVDDIAFTNKVKITAIEKSITDITFKYDKIFLDNLTVPGIIGTACPFKNLSSFMDYSFKRIKELLNEKDKQTSDLKSYKEKLEIIIASFNKQIQNIENKFGEYCNNSLKIYEKGSNDRYNLLEDKINNMRVENGKYSFDLIQKTDELKIKWEKLQSIQDEIYNKFNEELIKHVYTNNNLCKIFNAQRDEFKIIKSRFTELSDFIKDVRFRNNLATLNNSHVESEYEKKLKFRKMAKKINFNKKQQIDNDTDRDNSFEKNNNNENIQIINKENTSNKSFSDFIENNSKAKKKSSLFLNKPINFGKVTSTLKNYFNQNKEYRAIKFNDDKIVSKTISRKSVILNKKINANKNKNKNDNDNDFLINEGEKKVKEKIKKKMGFKSFKNIFSKDKSSRNLKLKNMNIKENEEKLNNSSKLLPLIPLKKDNYSKFRITKSRNNNPINLNNDNNNNLSNKNINTFISTESNYENTNTNDKEKTSKVNSVKNLKMANISNTESHKKGESTKTDTNKLDPTQKKIPDLSIEQIENILKTINNGNNNVISTYNNSKYIINKIKEKVNNNDNSVNNNDNFDDMKNKFSFITSTNNKNTPEKTDTNNNYNNAHEFNQIKINFNSLNKKVIKTNKKMNEMYQSLNIKYNQLYIFVTKIFGDLTGKLFFKETHKLNFFNLDFSPKNIFTATNYQMNMNMPVKVKKKYPSEKEKTNKDNKDLSPNIQKIDSFKSILNNIEPYLIKKFKEYKK